MIYRDVPNHHTTTLYFTTIRTTTTPNDSFLSFGQSYSFFFLCCNLTNVIYILDSVFDTAPSKAVDAVDPTLTADNAVIFTLNSSLYLCHCSCRQRSLLIRIRSVAHGEDFCDIPSSALIIWIMLNSRWYPSLSHFSLLTQFAVDAALPHLHRRCDWCRHALCQCQWPPGCRHFWCFPCPPPNGVGAWLAYIIFKFPNVTQ